MSLFFIWASSMFLLENMCYHELMWSSIASVFTENSSLYQKKGGAYGIRKIQIFSQVCFCF